MISVNKRDTRLRHFHSQRFCLRTGEEPPLLRASGDSAYVSHLNACTQGASGWDWSFRLTRVGPDWASVSDGSVNLHLDEPRQYDPRHAKPGDQVALRLPRVRENLYPNRFTVNGGQGQVVVGAEFTKFFIAVTFEFAPRLVESCCAKMSDNLRFSLYVANSPADYDRADSAIIDVGASDLEGVVRMLRNFTVAFPTALSPRGLPYSTIAGPLGLPTSTGTGREERADGYGWRRSAEALNRSNT